MLDVVNCDYRSRIHPLHEWRGVGSADISRNVAARFRTAVASIATTDHPDYFDPTVVIGGFMSHFFYSVPLALIVKRRLAPANA
jgi:hypothetical protein